MQTPRYSIDAEWPKFDSLNDLFDWLSDERARLRREETHAQRDNSESGLASCVRQNEALSDVLA